VSTRGSVIRNKDDNFLLHFYSTQKRIFFSAEQIHAYDNTAFSGHEMEERKTDAKADIERLGYEMYNGKNDKR